MITCVSAGGIVIAGEMQKVIKGIVKDSNGTPLAGVTVAVGNSNNTTTTDDNGAFMLDRVNEGDMLILTSVGFKRAQVTVENNDFIDITLEEDQEMLGEVVVVGYGQQKKDRKSTRLNSSH